MKNTKKYLNLALSIALCSSLHISAMEPIGQADTSSESAIEPTGPADTSRESGIEEADKQTLTTRIMLLNAINETLNKKLSQSRGNSLNKERDNNIKELQQRIQKTIQAANDMSVGLRPVNMKFIGTELDDIRQKASRL